MSIIIRRYTDHMKFWFFHILLVLLFNFIYDFMVCMLVLSFVYFVFLLLCMFLSR